MIELWKTRNIVKTLVFVIALYLDKFQTVLSCKIVVNEAECIDMSFFLSKPQNVGTVCLVIPNSWNLCCVLPQLTIKQHEQPHFSQNILIKESQVGW